MTVRLYIDSQRAGHEFSRQAEQHKKQMLAAQRGAANDVVGYVVPRVRDNIAGAGNFGNRWTEGFQGKVTEGGGYVRIAFTHAVPYWKVFQTGKVIKGRPLLWIPLSFAQDAKGVRARDYPGKLFRVDRPGKAPLLMTAKGGRAEAKYFGKESVRIPKKFRVVEIIRDGSKKMTQFFNQRMKGFSRG